MFLDLYLGRMPVVAVNLPDRLFGQIKKLVASGEYDTPSDFLEIAAFNQLALQAGADAGQLAAGRVAKARELTAADKKPRRVATPGARYGAFMVHPGQVVAPKDFVPSMEHFRIDRLEGDFPRAPTATKRPTDERVWVQFNRAFTLKAVARWLAATSIGHESWPDLASCSEFMVRDVAELGSALEVVDMGFRAPRAERRATGLPRKDNQASCARFFPQTVARISKTGVIAPGALIQYALAVVVDGQFVALTDRGCQLASLRNPILDVEDVWDAHGTLSAEEQQFLIEQVVNFVPGELGDFRAVWAAVSAGKDTPEDLADALRPALSTEWSAEVVRSHVAAVVARMAELDLVRREWKGRHVRYQVGEARGLVH